MSKTYICPHCKQRIGFIEYYNKGHFKKQCPLSDEQMEQLDRITKVSEDE